jgi:hypothetical protein
MRSRCYNPKTQTKKPTYIGCGIHPDWHDYSNFVDWCEANYVEAYFLDKDLLIDGNKVYGPDTCVFVPIEVNNLLLVPVMRQRQYPAGVELKSGKFRATVYCNRDLKRGTIRATPEEAYADYIDMKTKHVESVLAKHPDLSPTLCIAIRTKFHNQISEGIKVLNTQLMCSR